MWTIISSDNWKQIGEGCGLLGANLVFSHCVDDHQLRGGVAAGLGLPPEVGTFAIDNMITF